MKSHRLFLLLFGLCAMLTSCQSLQQQPAKPKPIMFECKLSQADFLAKAKQLLEANRYIIEYIDETKGEIQADRVPVYTGIGENIIVRGPYVFNASYSSGRVTIIVQTVFVREGKPIAVESHDERSEISDRRNFMPIIDGLRAACQ
ncbi:MAG: hypothetical protein SNJ55_03400 [Chloroherpetonaceae bacterium]